MEKERDHLKSLHKVNIEKDAMRGYTAKEIDLSKADPFTFKITKDKLYFTIECKEAFWTTYHVGMVPKEKKKNALDKRYRLNSSIRIINIF